MDALDLLLNRHSDKNLIAPAPNAEELEILFKAAKHVPDHGKLTPYRFVVIEHEGLQKLGDLLKDAVNEFNLGEDRLAKAEGFPKRAPMFIAVIAEINKEIKKVPAWEQMLSAGCATYALQLAANALGYANVWVTGPWIDGSALRQAFGCREHDKIVALVMIGTAQDNSVRPNKEYNKNKENFVSYL
ncbi:MULTISPECIES: nitroreductase family protein [Gallibacterium]|uniref:Putative NAD(P)H nitroreductase n=1 Tax=Gallibacterium genomosp. 3 TaxID=505345 RepID=A0A1A7PUT0_9PAST|nr:MULTISPECIES: nitroreductase family protein [Gallibacterium]MDA3978328.1 nitroreductase family protein [Gallibacterium sp. AGMB14963]OBW94026.1 NAD(P)H nitroreductase [Gallibacterium genomosp. 3]OBX05482.1 NAD(P)H nitroreductase [Gallibacterium genomosp. 3]